LLFMFPEAFSRVSLCILLRESSVEIQPKSHPIEVELTQIKYYRGGEVDEGEGTNWLATFDLRLSTDWGDFAKP
jgi:hypothetical protein